MDTYLIYSNGKLVTTISIRCFPRSRNATAVLWHAKQILNNDNVRAVLVR